MKYSYKYIKWQHLNEPSIHLWTFKCLLAALFFIDICVAQNKNESLYERTQKQVHQNMLQNSGDLQQIQEMKMLRDNFPGAAQYYDKQINQIYQQYSPVSNNPAQDIVNQQNRLAAKMMGVNLPPTQEEIDAEMKDQTRGKPPTLTEEQMQRQQISDLLNEAHGKEPSSGGEYWKAPDFVSKEKSYRDALNKLKEQLIGKRPLSVADAYFSIENAEGNTMINQKEFKEEINKCGSFIKRWMIENNYDINNNIAVHFSIQKFFSDSLKIGKKNIEIPDVPPQLHLPFYYDYEDYKAEKDNRSYHVSKGFATGNGQCHILPLMYACIAEALGAKFYLSYAPLHSFVKYPDNENKIHNYEPTTNWQISDQWYKDNMEVSSLAEKNQIYLNKMSRKEIVAAAIMDLAFSYKKNNGVADGKFINECVNFAMNYFPNKDANIDGWLMRGEITAVELDRLLMKKGVKAVSDAEQIPEAQQLIEKIKTLNKKVESLGYTEVDEEVYDKMVQDSKAHHQEISQKDNLKKRNLFIPLTPK